MSLNAEPSLPDERAAHDLPPKSYAAAAEEALEPSQSHANQTDGTSQDRHIVDGLKKIQVEEFEGAGLDTSPRSPKRGHRRKTSLQSNGSNGRKHGEHVPTNTVDEHNDAHGDALTTLKTSKEPKPLARRRSTLQTGRQAGAGWSRSKCVHSNNMRLDPCQC